MSLSQRTSFFQILKDDNPTPTTELNFSSPFELLIAVMLSAQATDVSVNKATTKLFPVANTPQQMLDLGLDELKNYIRNIGLFPTKAKHVISTCDLLLKHFNGQVPDNRKDLESLPGVGRKTANVVLNTAFNQPTIAVDTHIFRVSNRTGLAPGKTVLDVERSLSKRIPAAFLQDAHHWLILHGRYTCTARKPKCNACLVDDFCLFTDKHYI